MALKDYLKQSISFEDQHRFLSYADMQYGGVTFQDRTAQQIQATPPTERVWRPTWESEQSRLREEEDNVKNRRVDFAKIQERISTRNAMNQTEDTLPGERLSYRYVGYEFASKELRQIPLERWWDGQKFAPAATSWELQRSILTQKIVDLGNPRTPVPAGAQWLSPVVVPSGFYGLARVVGHVGVVSGVDLIAPAKMAAGSPWDVFVRGMLFVAEESKQPRPPDGWKTVGFSSHSYVVVASPDGQVVNILGTTDGDALKKSLDPIQLIKDAAKWVYDNRWEIALSILIPEVLPSVVALAARGWKTIAALVARLRSGKAVRGLLAGATEELAASATLTAAEASGLDFEVLAEGPAIPGTSVPQWVNMRVGARRFNISRNPVKLEPSGKPIGPATKHLAETLKGKGGTWNDQIWKGEIFHSTRSSNVWLQQTQADFPMSSLASGLQAAEREVLSGRLAAMVNRSTGAAMPGVYEVHVEGWEFMINTNESPWKVYHMVVR